MVRDVSRGLVIFHVLCYNTLTVKTLQVSLFAFAVLFNPLQTFAGQSSGIKVIASFYPVYIMAMNVARNVPGVSVADLTSLLTGCLHDYSLTVSDMKELADADIFLTSGAGMESFIDRAASRYPALKRADLSEGVSLIKEGPRANPHVWVSVSNAIIEVNNLGRAMERFDPAHAQLYRKNTAEYSAKLEALRDKMRLELAPYRGRKIITFHEAFPYFAREFGLEIAAVVEREPGSSPSAKELADTIELIRKSRIKALFSEPQYPDIAAKTIARET
ncbi:MAG: metal ABC transporter substrate-binding protein, partial [Deltaproteobacteria bacterium]